MLPMKTMTVHHVNLISDKKKKYTHRSFLVAEEKALLIAQESGDDQVMVDTIKSAITACVHEDIDVNKMATFDLEWIFLKLRMVSVGERVRLMFFCAEKACEENEKARVILDLNLKDVKVLEQPGHSPDISLFEDVSVKMRYPTPEMLNMIDPEKSELDNMFVLAAECIEAIYKADERFDPRDVPREEVMQFINSLNSEEFDKIQHFFDTAPKIVMDVEYKCPVCQAAHKRRLEGLRSFF